jgi:hypothetical protein
MAMANTDDPGNATYKITLEGDGVQINKALDPATAARVIELVVGGAAAPTASSGRSAQRRKRGGGAAPEAGEAGRSRRRRAGSPGIIKDLSLRPSGKQAFADFVAEKQPSGHKEQQVVAVYWLQHIAEVAGITVGHVNTCYREAGWSRPKDLAVSLRLTASKTGWLDTGDAQDITTTVQGEDVVLHGLPRPSED